MAQSKHEITPELAERCNQAVSIIALCHECLWDLPASQRGVNLAGHAAKALEAAEVIVRDVHNALDQAVRGNGGQS